MQKKKQKQIGVPCACTKQTNWFNCQMKYPVYCYSNPLTIKTSVVTVVYYYYYFRAQITYIPQLSRYFYCKVTRIDYIISGELVILI